MRHVALADSQIRRDLWLKPELVGRELNGKTAGVIGLGSIGTRIAALTVALGMPTLGCVARPSDARRHELAAAGVELCDLDEVVRRGDVLFVAVPLAEETRRLIDGSRLHAMRPTAYLINVSRGGVVDEQALRAALDAGEIAGAGLDVFEQEGRGGVLNGAPNTVLTPHIGAMTQEAQERIGEILLSSIEAALAGREVATRVC
jgi:phosphoglycerate dehydrogenase-like enzyme